MNACSRLRDLGLVPPVIVVFDSHFAALYWVLRTTQDEAPGSSPRFHVSDIVSSLPIAIVYEKGLFRQGCG